MYEANTSDWAQTQLGLGYLLKLRGPLAQTSSVDRQLFEDLRFQLIACALMMRRRSFLATEEWKTVPWRGIDNASHSSALKAPLHRLMDVLADIPGMLEDMDGLSIGFDRRDRDARCNVLRTRASQAVKQCQDWYNGWIQLNPRMMQQRTKDIRHCPLEVLLLPPAPASASTTLEFSTLLAANTFAMYHMTLILLYSILHALPCTSYGLLSYTPATVGAALDHSIDSIIASVPYHISPPESANSLAHSTIHSSNIGACFLMVPLRISMLSAKGLQRKWLDTVLSQLADMTKIPDAGASAFGGAMG